jgi:nitroreductase
MDLDEAIRGRRSVRSYEPRPVQREALIRLVEAACWAPSAGNLQTWKFVIVTEEQRLRKLRMVAPGMIGNPPAAIVVAEDAAESERRAGEVGAAMATNMDAAMAALNICLQAYADGLGSCVIGSFNQQGVARIVNLPTGIEPKLLVSVGYAARSPKAPQRKKRGVVFLEVYDG